MSFQTSSQSPQVVEFVFLFEDFHDGHSSRCDDRRHCQTVGTLVVVVAVSVAIAVVTAMIGSTAVAIAMMASSVAMISLWPVVSG